MKQEPRDATQLQAMELLFVTMLLALGPLVLMSTACNSVP